MLNILLLPTDRHPICLPMRYNADSCAHWLGIWCIIPLYKRVNKYIVPFVYALEGRTTLICGGARCENIAI